MSGRSCAWCKAPLPLGYFMRHCQPCDQEKTRLQIRVMALVARAVRRGEIAPAKTQACEDCGKPADRYDHRDYSMPLAVAAVCCSCNLKRGPATYTLARPVITAPAQEASA